MAHVIADGDGWGVAPEGLALGDGEVHVFRVDLALAAAQARSLGRFLRDDEHDRARRFHFDRHRDAFIGARASLRRILAPYVGEPAREILFRYTKYGKPFVVSEQGGDRLRFNLSHAHERALLAVTLGREIGVDVEWIRPDFTGEEIWERFFSVRERDVLRALDPSQRDLAFFQCWTRKEAYIKAAGPGLSIPLHSFDVTLGPGVEAALLATRPDAAEASRWHMRALEPGRGYAGAIAIEGAPTTLRLFDWPG